MSGHTFLDLQVGDQVDRLQGQIVSGNYFEVLGVRALIGQTFLPEEMKVLGRNPVAVLSESLWRRRFNADSCVVGQTIRLNQHSFTIIGVVNYFSIGVPFWQPEVWVPLQMHAQLQPDALTRTRRGGVESRPLD